MSQYPQRVLVHQQAGVQLQTQSKGLRTRSRTLRPIGADPSPRLRAFRCSSTRRLWKEGARSGRANRARAGCPPGACNC